MLEPCVHEEADTCCSREMYWLWVSYDKNKLHQFSGLTNLHSRSSGLKREYYFGYPLAQAWATSVCLFSQDSIYFRDGMSLPLYASQEKFLFWTMGKISRVYSCMHCSVNRIKYARSFRAWIGLLLAFSSSLMSIKLQIREGMGGESVWCPFSTHQIPKVGIIRNFPRFYPQYKFVGTIFRNLYVLKTCSWIIGIWFSLRQCLHFLNTIVFLFAYIYIAWNLMKYSVIVIQIGALEYFFALWGQQNIFLKYVFM